MKKNNDNSQQTSPGKKESKLGSIKKLLFSKSSEPSNQQKIDWNEVLSAFNNREPESFVDVNAVLVDRIFPKEKKIARSMTKAFLVGRNWNPELGSGGWKAAPGTAFSGGEISGLQQSASFLLVALDNISRKLTNVNQVNGEDILKLLNDSDFQNGLIEDAKNAGNSPEVCKKLVHELMKIT